MFTAAVARKTEKAFRIYRDLGLRSLVLRLARTLGRALGLSGAGEARWRARKEAVDVAFDAEAGVSTGGITHLYGLSIVGPNATSGVSHIACDPDEFRAALDALEADLTEHSFVDLGSGKGRALILAARYPFATIVGVEFAAELHAVATANVAALPAADRARISLVYEDASRFAFPDGPLVVFLNNPFEEAVCREVARHLRADVSAHPRPVRVVYLRPQHRAAWIDAGWSSVRDGTCFLILEPCPAAALCKATGVS
ncbi:hypothetical protein LNAOJCKE_4531 [Methylorubrum aminovorans]|uniref:Methyltransferase domain-containing protein n=1 Tax=Methylorubrum aminovorans TaxID=269069 RepID=A0ABQ4UJ36_9HYPH|nr:class I SAM-dependent methyltransferase [Methylorubrum aminovorans]GJE67300.1 hypothetical protein LNAOJCKE_4531 [Methylorubrum aminovorans]